MIKGLFTTSPNEVEKQIADMKVVSSDTESVILFLVKKNNLQKEAEKVNFS